MSDVQPQWLQDLGGCTMDVFDPDLRELTLVPQQTRVNPSFDVIPEGWTINIACQNSYFEVAVKLQRQMKGVHWHLSSNAESRWWLPRAMSAISVDNHGNYSTCQLNLASKSPRLTLSPGRYEINAGGASDGTYSVVVSSDSNQNSEVILEGPARLSRIQCNPTARVTVHSAAEELTVLGPVPRVTLNGQCKQLAIQGAGSVNLNANISERVDIECAELISGGLHAPGQLRATTARLSGEIAPATGRVEISISQELVARRGGRNFDLKFLPDPGGGAPPRAIFGGRDGSARIDLSPEPPVERDRGRALENVPKVNPGGAFDVADIENSSLTGGGVVEVTGSARALLKFDLTRFVVSGDMTLRAAGKDEEAPPKEFEVDLVAVGGNANLSGRGIRVGKYFQATGVAHGDIEGGDQATVVFTSAEEVSITASHIHTNRVTPSEVQISRSNLKAAHRLDLSVPQDTASSFELAGDGHIAAAIHEGSKFTWSPDGQWGDGDPRHLVLSAEVAALLIDSASALPTEAVLETSQGVQVRALRLVGAATIATNTTASDDALNELVLKRASHLVVAGGLRTVHSLGYRGDCALELLEGAGRLTVTANPLEPDGGKLNLLPGGGTIRLARPTQQDAQPESPRGQREIVAKNGTIEVSDHLKVLTCEGLGDNAVTVDVEPLGRIEELRGEFQTRKIHGRIAGVRQTDDEDAVTRLVRWHSQEPSSDRRGELTDVDISRLPAEEIHRLSSLHVLSPSPKPLIAYAKKLGPDYREQLSSWIRHRGHKFHSSSDVDVQAKAQKLREIADIVRSRANSSSTFTAAQWAASHAHALSIGLGIERGLRWLHRLVGYGVRPLPALVAYVAWTGFVTALLYFFDPGDCSNRYDTKFVPGPYGLDESLQRALLLPATILRSDLGGATPFRPAFDSALAHYLLVLGTGIVVGFLAVAVKNFLLRPKSDA